MHRLKLWLTLFVLLSVLVVYAVVHPYYAFVTKTLGISPWRMLFPGKALSTVDNKVNILILGIAGGTHDGPNLSDSIMVLHYDFKTNTLVSIGLPRDVWSDTLRRKINTAYAIGEAKKTHGGLTLAKAEVGGILGLPIDYGAVITFKTFKELIDYFGGVTVEVKRSFTDREYPLEGKENDPCGGDPEYRCRYETISFTKGSQHMDGTTALKFVRSRHASGTEGSDFARSQRQQQVLSALKGEIVTVAQSRNVTKMTELYNKINSLVERDITNQQLAVIARNVMAHKGLNQRNVSFPKDYFEVPDNSKYEGQYVLVPPDSDYNRMHDLVSCLLGKPADECEGYSE